MIKTYHCVSYRKEKYVGDVFNQDSFSSCCGSRYYEKATRLCNAKGIALFPGVKFKEGEHKKNTVKHIDTPDGPITLVTRTVW